VLSTVNVALGPVPEALFPAVSVAVPLPMLIPSVPFPVILLMDTVGVLVVPLLTDIVPVAVPVVFRVIAPTVRLTEFAPL
jgi:hypothetical protein